MKSNVEFLDEVKKSSGTIKRITAIAKKYNIEKEAALKIISEAALDDLLSGKTPMQRWLLGFITEFKEGFGKKLKAGQPEALNFFSLSMFNKYYINKKLESVNSTTVQTSGDIKTYELPEKKSNE